MGERRYEVLVVGSANADLTVRVERRPGAGETVLGSDLAELPGGKGANQAAAAARLGARTALLARIGGDGLGRMLLDALAAAGADTAPVVVDGRARTGTALITVGPDGDNSIVVSPGANGRLSAADAEEAAARGLFAESAVVSMMLEVPYGTVASAARLAAGAGARVVLNPSPVPAGGADALPEGVLALADPLIVNEHEAQALSGSGAGTGAGPEDWARALRRRGARSVVVTLGGDGALALDGGGAAERVPGVPARAVDTTGAGDAFTGAVALCLARGESLAEAVRFAVRAGAAVVAREGAQSAYAALDALRR